MVLEAYPHEKRHIPTVFWLGDCVFLSLYNAITIVSLLDASLQAYAFVIATCFALLFSMLYQFCENQFQLGRVTPPILYHIQFTLLQSF
jgi:hypothetical protein